MADVYHAWDPVLAREVAVKAPRIENQDDKKRAELLGLFAREARAVARLSHENIVRVLDSGEQDGRPFLVMEYMPNGSLADRLYKDRKIYTLEEALPIIRRVAEALDYLHRQEEAIIHLDVKPGNILFDQEDNAHLSDFGIVRFIAAITPSDDNEQTDRRLSKVRGTAAYMSPEHAVGRGVTRRSDIYSLGVVLHEMLTGYVLAGTADSPTAPGVIRRDVPVSLPPAVRAVIDRATAIGPDSRYESASAFVQALEGVAAGLSDEAAGAAPVDTSEAEDGDELLAVPLLEVVEETVVPPPQDPDASPPGPATRPPGRRFLVPLGGLLFLFAIGLLWLAAFRRPPPPPPPPTATVQVTVTPISPTATPGQTDTPVTTETPTSSPTGTDESTSSPTGTSESTPSPTSTPTLTPSATSTPALAPRAVEALANVFTRSGPGPEFPIDGSLRRGQVVPVIARDLSRLWFLVEWSAGRAAWVFIDYIVGADGTDLNSINPATTIPPTPTPTWTPTPPPPTATPTSVRGGTGPSPTATLPCIGYCP